MKAKNRKKVKKIHYLIQLAANRQEKIAKIHEKIQIWSIIKVSFNHWIKIIKIIDKEKAIFSILQLYCKIAKLNQDPIALFNFNKIKIKAKITFINNDKYICIYFLYI